MSNTAINIYTMTAPVFAKMLRNARTWLDKALVHAEHKKFDPSVYMTLRLAPDMFTFARQIQNSSDHAKGCMARLAGVDIPRFEDNEQSLAELQARIDKTVAFVESIRPEQLNGSESKEIIVVSPRGERRFPSGSDYFRFYAMPNFFFHMTTAYDILRHNGVDVGKADFLNGFKG